MLNFLNAWLDIVIDVLTFLVSPDNFWFSSLLYITFIFALIVLLYQILRGRT